MKADIFFFIVTIESILLTLLFSIALFYLIRAVKNLHQISEALQKHFKDSEEFATELKERLENNAIFRFFFPPSKRKTRHKEE